MPGMNIQEQLFQQVRQLLPPSVPLVDAVAEVLHLSNDSAYRRIRGETPLLLEEAARLCGHYRIPLDGFLAHKEGTTSFQVVQLRQSAYSFEAYLSGILKGIQQLAALKDTRLVYLTKDLGLFHIFHFRSLFAFRYFFWMKSILLHPDFQNRKFSADCLPAHIEKLGSEILQAYNNIPSTEIWNSECVNSTLSQVAYYREAGFFARPEEVRLVFQALQQTVLHLKEEAERGCKFRSGESTTFRKQNFQLFYNRLVLGDNTILVEHEGGKAIYLNYDVLNYMFTRDETFCTDVSEQLYNLMKRSTMISSVGEKQRDIFFNTLMKKIPRQEQDLFQ